MVKSNPRVYIPYVNGIEMTVKAAKSLGKYSELVTFIDNSPKQQLRKELEEFDGDIAKSVRVYKPDVPLFTAQTFNLVTQLGNWESEGYAFLMHNDAEASETAYEAVLNEMKRAEAESPEAKTMAVFTIFDAFCLQNCKLYKETGGFDTEFMTYFCDDDFYYRAKMGGYSWKYINRPDVVHHGSMTIKIDPMMKKKNELTHEWRHSYYRAKWGGSPKEEKFTTPFGL